MAAKKPAKKPSKGVSMSTARRGVGKTTPRISTPKKRTKAEINQLRLQADINYFKSQPYLREANTVRVKTSRGQKRGVLLSQFIPVFEGGKLHYESPDGKVKLTRNQRDELLVNPFAVPHYVPIKKNGKIVRFRNSITGEEVTPYYRYQIFGKKFKTLEGEVSTEQERMALAYEASRKKEQQLRTIRHYNLLDSYRVVNPGLTINEASNSPEFKLLVEQLTVYSKGISSFNEEYWQSADAALGIYPDPRLIEEQTSLVRQNLRNDPNYIAILVALGRRLPTDTHPVGDSPPGYITREVVPYYQEAFGAREEAEDYEEE